MSPLVRMLAKAVLPLVAVLVALSVAPAVPFAVPDAERGCCEGEEAPVANGGDCCPEGDCGACHLSCCGHFVVLGGVRPGPQRSGEFQSVSAGPPPADPRPAPLYGIEHPPQA